MPPPNCDMALPRPVSRGSMYSSCASSTCNWPSRVRAWRAKMSRINCVRSSTRQGSAASRLRSCVGVRSWSKSTRSASWKPQRRQSPPPCRSRSAWPDRAAGGAAAASATTWPPALDTSSRNSARDSSASRPGDLARKASSARRSGLSWEASESSGAPGSLASRRTPGRRRARHACAVAVRADPKVHSHQDGSLRPATPAASIGR